jgi:Transposase DDE domain
VSFYPAGSSIASVCGEDVGKALGASGIVAVPLSALIMPVRENSVSDGRSGLVVAGAERITAGEPVAWCKVVVVAPALLRRDGRVQAQGRPCEHARLGALEQELDRRCGPGTIDRVAAGVRPTGKIKARARREMSVAFTIRAVLLMTVMPEADAREVLTTLLGDLLEVPWRRPHTVPSGTVLSTWRAAIGPAPLQQLQREVLAAVVTEHRDDTEDDDAEHRDDAKHRDDTGHRDDAEDNDAGHRDDTAARVEVGGGLRLGAIDGTVTRMPDTAANRAAFGTAGQAETGYPQIRHLHISDAVTRATLAVVTGPAGGDKAEAEQALLDRALTEHPDVFTPDRLWIMDRNFPGVPRIKALLGTGSHVLIRVKSDIRLRRISPFAQDGSYLATVSGGGTTLIVRVIEYYVSVDGQTTPELLGRTGAPCQDRSWWVSPARPPHPACDSHRTGRSTCLASGSAVGGGCRVRCPRGRDPATAVAVTGDRDAGCAGEGDPVVGDPPSDVAEATSEFFHPEPVLARVLGPYPPHQPTPRVVVDRTEHVLGHPVSEVGRPPDQGLVETDDQLVQILVPG